MANKYLDKENGLPALWAKVKEYFVQKEDGKVLSSNDYTDTEKTKLAGIATGANKTTVDSALSDTSTNPVQNKAVKAALDALPDTNTTYTLTKSGSTITLTGSDNTTTSVSDSNTTYSNMKGASSTAAGSAGLVPAPASGKQASFLRGDGTWVVPTNTTYSTATQSANGLMSSTDKKKLDGVDTGAEANVIESVKVNGTALTVSSKAVNVTVPTKVSALTNDSGYQTADQVTTAINNALTSAVTYKGSVTVANLPTSGQKVGDMYNLTDESTYGPAGMNVSWNGSTWDAMGSTITVEAITAAEIAEICVI